MTALARPVRLTAVLFSALAAALSAQNPPGLRNHFRLSLSMSGAPQEVRVDSGWVATGPLSTPGSGANSIPGGCFSQGSCTATSDYGELRCSGTGQAASCSVSGVFLWLDEWIGASPKARFRDVVTVTSSTLPANTPAQVRFTIALDGHAVMNDASPSVVIGASVVIGPSNTLYTVQSAPATMSGIVTVPVGQPWGFEGWLDASLIAYGALGLNASASYDLDLVARMGLEPLTPGTALATASGHAYATNRPHVNPAGGGCGTGSPQLAATLPTLGSNVTFDLTGAPANAAAIAGFVFGDPVASAFGPCTLQLLPGAAHGIVAGVTDAAGTLSAPLLTIPLWPALAGLHVTVQDAVLQTGGPLLSAATLSNALLLEVGY
ncbi:MAG: hypothetical protein KDE27_00930 [Planctomycetes bacterium]|nr:hypothetical protein [Planctomycetota bacterium]